MKILLIDENPGDVVYFKTLIAGIKEEIFQFEVLQDWERGNLLLTSNQFDVIFCSLLFTKSNVLESLNKLLKFAANVPLIILTSENDENSGFQAVKMGAQDFIPKSEISSQLLYRVIMNTIHRKAISDKSSETTQNDTKIHAEQSSSDFEPHRNEFSSENKPVPSFKNQKYSFLQELIDNIPSPIFYKNKDLIYTGCNKAFAEYVGHPVEKIIGSTVLEISPLELAVVYHDADAGLLKRRGKQVYESKVRYADGSLRDVIFYKSCYYDSNGKPDGIVGLILDISDKKKTLDKLKIESTFNEGIAELSAHLLQPGQSLESISKLVLKCAQQFTGALHGYTGTIDPEKEELIIHSFSEMIPHLCELDPSNLKFEKKDDAYPALWGQSLNTCKAFYINQIENLLSTTGTQKDNDQIRNFLSVPTISEGKIVGQISLANTENGFSDEDLHRIQRLSFLFAIAIQKNHFVQDLMMAKEKAEQSDKLKSAFLANMSHEIRTPLNAIVGFSEMMADAELSQEESKQFRNIISQNSDMLLKLISDIIEMAMIEAGELKIKTQESVIHEIALEAYNFFALNDSFLAKKKHLDYQFLIDPRLANSFIDTDPVRLTQILKNLIQNAFRFTKSGFIKFGYRKVESVKVEFFVEDTGIGISKEQQKFIFDKFRQVDEHKVRPYSGTGLGLSITKKLVEKLNGNIILESEPGKGTTFRIIFPLAASNLPEGETFPIKTSDRQVGEKELDGMTILIVEDNPSSFEFLGILLKTRKCRIIHALDGLEAIRKFSENPEIDIILMDLQLPEMDGYKAIEAIRKLNSTIPIIVQTAFSTNIERTRAFEAGCNAFLIKPLTKRGLFEAINHVIH